MMAAMELTLNGTPAIAGAGQIVLFDCREPYSYAASDGLEFTWLLFNGLNARVFYQKILRHAAAGHFRRPHRRRLRKCWILCGAPAPRTRG